MLRQRVGSPADNKLTCRILNAVGEHWKMQRNAGKVFASSSLLDYLTMTSLPAHLPRMLAQLDAAADKDEVIDLGEVMVEYIFAVFGDVAFDVSDSR